MKSFNLFTDPLDGTNLIQASAGTGKTHTITGLYLRLILEKEMPVEKILTVTFTDAATQELKGRIRKRLAEAISAFSGGKCDDPFLNSLVTKQGNTHSFVQRLRDALNAFDQAAIFTIHGFCLRMLQEHAVESGSLFDTELLTNREELLREIVADFWRTYFYPASPLFINFALSRNMTPETWFAFLGNFIARRDIKIIPQVNKPETALAENQYAEAFRKVSQTWHSSRQVVEDILLNHDGLNRNAYRVSSIPRWIVSMNEYLMSGPETPILFKEFEKFTAQKISGCVKKGYSPPGHPFFTQCGTLKESHAALEHVLEHYLLWLKGTLFGYVEAELEKRKERGNTFTFDDLIHKLSQALGEEGGETLVERIRQKFSAALIDEFQDTDPVQYGIFHKIFGEKSILYLIGDPKQSIYGFRGADIFAYIGASKRVARRYTLEENWRSEPELIRAVNTLFSTENPAFVFPEITFSPAKAANKLDRSSLKIKGESDPPLQMWLVEPGDETGAGKSVPKTAARETISTAVAAEISQLLTLAGENQATLGGRPLLAGDIAVLVRKNREASLIRNALLELRIPSVFFSMDNLFASFEAAEMKQVLSAIAFPDSDAAIKTALSTDMMGLSGEEIEDLESDETRWEQWLARFREYHEVWQTHGFIRMCNQLLRTENILPRLMAFTDGERRATNLLHLTEVLQGISTGGKTGMEGLVKWLREQIETLSLPEHQLRLESDENAVKIVTIHKSKGMEYPVVFCPFMWGGSRIGKKEISFSFHDPVENLQMTLDLGSKNMEANRGIAERELLAENLRLLYVAFTRAVNRCYFAWGAIKDTGSSAPAYLFHASTKDADPDAKNDLLTVLEKKIAGLTGPELRNALNRFTEISDGAICVSSLTGAPGKKRSSLQKSAANLMPRQFKGKIDRTRRISSFSSLISGQMHGAQLPDCDAVGEIPAISLSNGMEAAAGEIAGDIFSFPRGVKAGTFMHDIFEHLDFTEDDPGFVKGVISEKLTGYGFDQGWMDSVYGMIQNVLSVPLDPDIQELRLSAISIQDRLNEMEFYFSLKPMTPGKLNSIFSRYAPPRAGERGLASLGSLHFSPVKGFMKGFVDLVFKFRDRFFIVDWKSNHLGDTAENYASDRLTEVMTQEGYGLQYHIYTLALDQYLKRRLPGYSYETHFGGAYYIFLRGVDAAKGPGFGIYRDRPSPDLIHALNRELMGNLPDE